MHRRLALAALACSCGMGVLAAGEETRPRQKVSAGQLYEALAARFPVRFGLAALLELRVDADRLLLLPARNRVGAALVAQVSGLDLRTPQSGEMEVSFALRYEPSDRSVRAHQAEVLSVRWPGMPPDTAQAVQALLPGLARQMGEVVLHRFTPRELALPDTMGFQPEEIRVVDDGLMVFFGPKPRP